MDFVKEKAGGLHERHVFGICRAHVSRHKREVRLLVEQTIKSQAAR
jgi:hypothetical protein